MRKILSPEQVAQVVADITTWMAHIAEIATDDKEHWQEATIHSIVQIAEIVEVEVYLVILTFYQEIGSYIAPFLLKRVDGRMVRLNEYTFFPPDFTHPTQAHERDA